MSIQKTKASSAPRVNDILIGALLSVPALAVQRRIIHELNQAGFTELQLFHIPVLRFPGPHGQRPGVLAERAGISKQAMNKLLGSLEASGYLERADLPGEGRARIINFTKRGHAAYAEIFQILKRIEREWSAELGPRNFAQLKKLLARVYTSPLIH